MKLVNKFLFIAIFLLLSFPVLSQDNSGSTANASERQLDTLRYGTDTEIASLIQTLKTNNDTSLDDALLDLAQTASNKSVLAGILTFFGDRQKSGLEERAVRIIQERDYEANETVLAAVDYLGRVNAAGSADILENLIRDNESRFLYNAIRALGRAVKDSAEKDSAAQFLMDYYNRENLNNENEREIIIALGETGSSEAVAFLCDLVSNPDGRLAIRMAALDSLGKIGDPGGLDAIIEAVSTADPNVRSTAIAALGSFSGEAVDRAILEGFRDSYYRSRIGACQAAGQRKMEAAVPFLRYRAENDEVATVKDEAVKALGAIWNTEAIGILESFFSERKNSDRIRLLAGEMLLTNDAAKYTAQAIVELDDAKTRNQTALYNGILRILSPGRSTDLEALARRFFASGSVVEKSYAMDIAVNNNFTSLEEDIRNCLDEAKNGASLARKAQTTLEKLGLL